MAQSIPCGMLDTKDLEAEAKEKWIKAVAESKGKGIKSSIEHLYFQHFRRYLGQVTERCLWKTHEALRDYPVGGSGADAGAGAEAKWIRKDAGVKLFDYYWNEVRPTLWAAYYERDAQDLGGIPDTVVTGADFQQLVWPNAKYTAERLQATHPDAAHLYLRWFPVVAAWVKKADQVLCTLLAHVVTSSMFSR